jgi:hypothetical protein
MENHEHQSQTFESSPQSHQSQNKPNQVISQVGSHQIYQSMADTDFSCKVE